MLRRLALIGLLLLGGRSALAADLVTPVPPLEPARTATAPAAQAGRITIIEENDALIYSPTDRWYTQGFEAHYLSTPIATGTGADLLLPGTFLDPGSFRTRRFDLLFGQQMFTPVDLHRNPPDPTDRPYAAWLYGGFGLLQETDRWKLDHFELQLGVVGPAALGKQVQDGFHGLLAQISPPGWAYQLKNEPGIVVSYERKWRFGLPLGGGFSVDAIPEVGASVGNVYTYAEAGTLFRFGQNLNADYGAVRMRPALSGTTWFDPTQLNGPLGWYVFVGGQGRAVARDIFLDGNTWQTSPSVEKVPLVGDLTAGFSVFWADLFKLDAVFVWRTKEFVNQSTMDRYGGFNVTFKLP
jgi:lipid A 3-O-deacylase